MNHHKVQFVSLCMGLSLVLLSCSNPASSDSGENSATEVRIGSIMPMTGALAAYGEYAYNGQVKAVEELNASQTKFIFTLALEDGKSEGKEAITAYRKLRAAGVNVITSGSSVLSMPLLPMVREDSVLFFPSSSHPGITEQIGPLIFRNFITADQEVPVLLKAIEDNGGGRTALLWVNDDFGNGFQSATNAQIGRFPSIDLIVNESITKGESNYAVILGKLKQQKVENILLVGYGSSASAFVNKLREHRMSNKVYCSFSYLLTDADKSTIDKANVFCVTGVADSVDPKEFCDYSTIKLIGNAILNTGSTNAKVLGDYLGSKHSLNVDGMEVTIGKNHEVEQGLQLVELK